MAMNCTDVQVKLDAYVDGELDAAMWRACDAHLFGCAACAAMLAERQALHEAIRRHAPDFQPSPRLRARIKAMLATGATAVSAPLQSQSKGRHWWGYAVAAALSALLTLGFHERQRQIDMVEALKDDAVSVYMRSLQENHLVDLHSGDAAQLASWFSQRLPYRVPVHDLSAQGYELIGGRLEYLYAQPLAALVYKRGDHLINLLVWPISGVDAFPSALLQEDRLRIRFIRNGGSNLCVISDLDVAEFEHFLNGLRNALSTSPSAS